MWLGLGSNLLVRDGGFSGTVISTSGTLQQLTVDGQTITAEVGVYCAKLAKQAAKAGLAGTAFLAGIPGSVFRNPEGDFAGRLIEICGLKGLKVGGASVSEKHANFIVNDGTATAADIEKLIMLVQQQVEQIQGVKLVTEVHILGEVK